MKRVFFLAASTLFVIVSCKNADETSGTSTTVSRTDDNSNTVYRAIETGDVSKLDSVMTPDILDHGASPSGGDVKGIDSVKKLLMDVHEHFTDIKVDVLAQGSGGDYHFTFVKFTGTSKDSTNGIPVGTKVTHTAVDVVKLRNGKANEHWRFVNPIEMMNAMKSMEESKENEPNQ